MGWEDIFILSSTKQQPCFDLVAGKACGFSTDILSYVLHRGNQSGAWELYGNDLSEGYTHSIEHASVHLAPRMHAIKETETVQTRHTFMCMKQTYVQNT